jgi:DNA-binding response OmpR family regulator
MQEAVHRDSDDFLINILTATVIIWLINAEMIQASTSMKILIVEDEAHIRLFLSANLKARGFEVIEASAAERASQILTTFEPDLILLDILLPDMPGWEFAKWLAGTAEYKHIPVILITASLADFKTEYEHSNIIDRYMKPISTEDLLNAVYNIADRNKAL